MGVDPASVRLQVVQWLPCFRIIPARFPPIDLFERVADPGDLDTVLYVESLTNDRLRAEVGELELLPREDWITGPGTGYIMAAFTHVAPTGGRFTDGTFGAYYAAADLATAVAETVYHRERFMAYTREPPAQLDMRVLRADLDGELHDLRRASGDHGAVYDPSDYTASQAIARTLRAARSWGVLYDSVRNPGGECVAVFRPGVLSRCRQAEHLAYLWDGTRIAHVIKNTLLR
jgi:RES domain-containing protein